MFRLNRKRTVTKTSSEAALGEARVELDRIKGRHVEVTQVTTALRDLRERNHFAEQLMVIMGGPNVGK